MIDRSIDRFLPTVAFCDRFLILLLEKAQLVGYVLLTDAHGVAPHLGVLQRKQTSEQMHRTISARSSTAGRATGHSMGFQGETKEIKNRGEVTAVLCSLS